MSWFVLQCRSGTEKKILNSCRQNLSKQALRQAFIFQSERLWRVDGSWRVVKRDLFPGYIFLESSRHELLSRELKEYRGFVKVMEAERYLLSVYEEEEDYLRRLCGESHILALSYGYKDRESGDFYITDGPLKNLRENIKTIDWHKRFARMEVRLSHKKAVIWAGLDIAKEATVS